MKYLTLLQDLDKHLRKLDTENKMQKAVLILAILIVGFFGWRVVNYFSNTVKTAVKEELSIEESAGDNYLFYYPKEWVQQKVEGELIGYAAKDEKGEETGDGIGLKVFKYQQQLKPASKETCNAIAQDLASSNQSEKGEVTSVTVWDTHPTYEGCRIVNKFGAEEPAVILEAKAIWYKDRRDNNIYTSQASYYNNIPEELKSTIKDAVNQFSIK